MKKNSVELTFKKLNFKHIIEQFSCTVNLSDKIRMFNVAQIMFYLMLDVLLNVHVQNMNHLTIIYLN